MAGCRWCDGSGTTTVFGVRVICVCRPHSPETAGHIDDDMWPAFVNRPFAIGESRS